MTPRCIVVDDEPLARRRLCAMLAPHADFEVLGEFEDADGAVAAIRSLRPDVVFLDVQMPGASGFDVVDAARVTPPPFVVFASAHAQHAVRAFDADAADYLLKPFDDQRLARSLARVREALARRRERALADEVRSLVQSLHAGARDGSATTPTQAATEPDRVPYLQRLAVTVGPRTLLVKVADVDWIEASGNYVALHVGPQRYLLRLSLTALDAQLDPAAFARIHRSAMVQIDRVREIRALGSGDYKVTLLDGTVLAMSQRYRGRLRGV